MLLKKILTLLLISAVVFGCRKDIDNDITITETIIFPNEAVTASLFVQIRSQSGDGVEGAIVTLGTEMRISNADGMVYFKDVAMNAEGTLVKIEKEGFFDSFKMFNPRGGNTDYLYVKLIARTLLGSVAAADGGALTMNGDAKVTLPANGIKDESGNVYSGEVRVFGAWLDPSDAEVVQTMPGDLRGVDQTGEFKQLLTYGMVTVELESPDGQPLQIADGSLAQIEMLVPESLVGQAPPSIPLWHFDEASGYWIEEGTAQLVDGKYVGDVAHFTYWNCDDFFDWVQITGRVFNLDGSGAAGLIVNFQIIPNGLMGTATTDLHGYYTCNVPAGFEFEVTVHTWNCPEILSILTIGPFEENTTLEADEELYVAGFGSVLTGWIDCSGSPVTSGYAKINSDGNTTFVPISENGYSFGIISYCEGSDYMATIQGFDLTNALISDVIEFEVSPATVQLGLIEICDEPSEYIIIDLNGQQLTIFNPYITALGQGLYLSGADEGGGWAYNFKMMFPDDAPGTYPVDSLSLNVSGAGNYYVSCGMFSGSCIEATHSGIVPVGEIVTGNFEGDVQDGEYSVSGIFKAIMQ
jgi:hypothetical protein